MDSRVEFVKERNGAREFRLTSNGLRVLLVPRTVGKVIAFMVHYNIGSRNEGAGYTGSTHFLEHLMFKGSKNFPKDKFGIDKMMAKIGAVANASTWYDYTNYWEIFTPEHLDLFMAIEADRMRNATFSDQDRQDEMAVVRNELEMVENDPDEVLEIATVATAIQQHPYHWDTGGYITDVENVSTERFREFYDTFYYPNNALVILIGNFEESQMLNAVAKHFGNLESSPRAMQEIYTQEPPQQGERRVIVRRPGGNGIIKLAWMTPGATHPDFAAVRMLSYALSSGNRGLLKSKFVDTGRVASAETGHYAHKDPFPFFVEVNLLRQGGHASVEREMRKYLETLQKDGLTEEILERAKVILEARELYKRVNLRGVLNAFSSMEGAGGWELYYTIPEETHNVTLEDVMRVFRKYLVPDNLTVGWYVPTKASSSEEASNG